MIHVQYTIYHICSHYKLFHLALVHKYLSYLMSFNCILWNSIWKVSYWQYIRFVTVIVNIWYLDSYNSFLEIIVLTCMLQVNSISFSSDFSQHNLFSILHFFLHMSNVFFFHVGVLELNYSYCYLFNVIIQWSLSNT